VFKDVEESSGDSCIGAVVIPEGVTSIGELGFKSGAAITSIHIPASVTSIGNGAFDGAGVRTVTFAPNSGMTSIGDYAFFNANSLSSISIPSSVTSINGAAFMYTSSLTSFVIPESVTSIGNYAFHRSGLTSITIPASVTEIGVHAFDGASALATVTFAGNGALTVGSEAFSGVARSAKAIFPNGIRSWYGLEVVDLVAVAAEQARVAAEQARVAAEQARVAAEQARVTAVAAEPASGKVLAKNSLSAKSLAQRVGIPIVSPKAKVSMTVSKSSKKKCAVVSGKLITLKAGKCVLTFTVQEPKSKKGKQPKAKKTTKTFVVK
jgi:hypothetical protein